MAYSVKDKKFWRNKVLYDLLRLRICVNTLSLKLHVLLFFRLKRRLLTTVPTELAD